MQPSSRAENIPWADVFALRYRQNTRKPLHVKVVEACASVTNARAGDELFLHEIKTDQISVKLHSAASRSQSGGNDGGEILPSDRWALDGDDDVLILLPSHYSGSFILYPRYPPSYCFLSVQEILDALPAVSRLIYSAEGFAIGNESVKAMERLEIIDQICDSSTGTEMLCVRSMKTEANLLLPGTMKMTFMQLSNDCFRCTSYGISAWECIMRWKPGQPPLRVKICRSKPRNVAQTLTPLKDTKQKKDKKDKKKKHSSCGDLEHLKVENFLSALDAESSLIPDGWKDKILLIKPFQRIRVQNIMFDAKDFTLPENAKLTVRLVYENPQPTIEKTSADQETRVRPVSASGRYSGPLAELPMDLVWGSKEPVRLMVADGEMSTVLRQQLRLFQGCRLAVHRVQQAKKIVMVCAKAQRFLVSKSYSGTFKRLSGNPSSREFRVETLFSSQLPCEVQTFTGDKSLGYDQLFRRNVLTATDTLTETTLLVEMFGADGQIVSEQPFEIPLSRTNLSVSVLDAKSPVLTGSVSMERVRTLPSVEFVTNAQVEALKNSMEQENTTPSQFTLDYPSVINDTADVQRIPHEQLYSSLIKSRKVENAAVAECPPPRPPKPLALHEPGRAQLLPPARPPKPNRYKGFPETHSPNFNHNNNAEGKASQPSAPSQLQHRSRLLREMRSKMETTFLQEESGSQDKKSGSAMSRRPALTKQKSRATSFEALHEKYDPRKYPAEELLIQLDEKRPAENAAADDKSMTVGIYGESDKPLQRVSGFKRALNKALQEKSKRGIRMVNPNYAVSIGEDIIDPALGASSVRDAENELVYEFAADVQDIRPALTSFADDEDEYENPVSPLRDLPASADDDGEYICMWPGFPQGAHGISSTPEEEEEYEAMYERLDDTPK